MLPDQNVNDSWKKQTTVMGVFHEKKMILVIISILVLAASALFLVYQWNQHQKAAALEAINLGESLASFLHTEHILKLSGTIDDLEDSNYVSTKESLIRLVETSASIRFAYIMGRHDTDLVFWMDSEPPTSEDYSPPGQLYDEATAQDWEPFLTGETVLTTPLTDRWGTWISVLIPIFHPEYDEVIAVLGLDYNASAWRARVNSQILSDIIIISIIIALYVTLLNVWAHRQMYKNLSKKLEWDEALYHSIFDQAPIGIAVIHDDVIMSQSPLNKVSVNLLFTQILGRTQQELQDISWVDITHPDDVKADAEYFDAFHRGDNNGYSMEKRYYRPDRSIVWTNMRISSLVGLPYKSHIHLCLLEDITARKEAEALLRESERSKTVLVSNLPGLAYRCNNDHDWTMQFVSAGCFKLTGYEPEMLIGNKTIAFNDIIAPEYQEKIHVDWQDALAKNQAFKAEYEIVTASGKRKWVLEMGEGVCNTQGEVEALEGIILDITNRKEIEEKLQKQLMQTQSMIENHQAIMLLIEPDSGKIIEANKAALAFYGYSKRALLRMTIQDINTMDAKKVAEHRQEVMEKGQRCFTSPHRLKSGEVRVVDVYSSPIEYDNRTVLFSILFDVTKREEGRKQIEYLAFHDYLTGLYNRRFFEEEYERQAQKAVYPIGLFLGDVDGFKVYNDTYGHTEGDRVLRDVAVSLKTFVGQSGLLARIGGDEFAILVSGMDKNKMRSYLDKLNQEYVDTHYPDKKYPIAQLPSISWGYALQKDAADTLDDLEEEAEAFMYNRKFYSHQSLRSKTVNTIMETLFTKSEREKLHSERVGLLSEEIAKHMHLPSEKVDQIRVAGFLHDIGKIGVDEAILNKAGRLNSDEMEMIKLHPAKSAGILDKTREYQNISNIVLSHHERYDGNGYPGKLSATDIPLEARIIAVADTFDALTNDRPYRKGMDMSAAITELRKSAGTQLDPEIVAVLIDSVLEQGNNSI